jgi:hypothetical protein
VHVLCVCACVCVCARIVQQVGINWRDSVDEQEAVEAQMAGRVVAQRPTMQKAIGACVCVCVRVCVCVCQHVHDTCV